MKQQELIEAFISGETTGTAKSLSIDGKQLIHYNTVIAERTGEKIVLNYTRYSLATGKVQKMITDTVDPSKLVYVSSVPSDTRSSLVDYLPQTDFAIEQEPESYLMRIAHEKFGVGYVTSIEAGSMTCIFGHQEKTLMYPMVIDSGIVKIVEDRR